MDKAEKVFVKYAEKKYRRTNIGDDVAFIDRKYRVLAAKGKPKEQGKIKATLAGSAIGGALGAVGATPSALIADSRSVSPKLLVGGLAVGALGGAAIGLGTRKSRNEYNQKAYKKAVKYDKLTKAQRQNMARNEALKIMREDFGHLVTTRTYKDYKDGKTVKF